MDGDRDKTKFHLIKVALIPDVNNYKNESVVYSRVYAVKMYKFTFTANKINVKHTVIGYIFYSLAGFY